MKQQKAIVIGSGVAGLAASIRLAVNGFNVTVYEKNASAGGKLNMFEKNGYRFDGGPSLFTQPENIEELFLIAGENIHDYFNCSRVDNTCSYFLENGKVIHANRDMDVLADELKEKAGEDPGLVKKYLVRSAKLYED